MNEFIIETQSIFKTKLRTCSEVILKRIKFTKKTFKYSFNSMKIMINSNFKVLFGNHLIFYILFLKIKSLNTIFPSKFLVMLFSFY